MRYGYCASLGDEALFAAIAAAGYDYIETQLTHLLDYSPRQLAQAKQMLCGLPCRAGMMIFPYSMPLVSEGRDLHTVEEHAKRSLYLAGELGCEHVVFGHGGTRQIPEGMEYEQVRARLLDVLLILSSLAETNGVKIAIEPLCDTNMITSYPEAAALAAACGDSTGTVFDLYHAMALGQQPADIALAPQKLFHLHIACPGGRTAPAFSDDQTCYSAFAAAARQCGYDGKISVEAGIPGGKGTAEAVAEALKVLRKHFNQEAKP